MTLVSYPSRADRPTYRLVERQESCQTLPMPRNTILPPADPARGGIGEYLGQLPPTGQAPLGSPSNDLGDPTVPAGTATTLLPAPYGSIVAPKPNFSTGEPAKTENCGPVPCSDRSDSQDFGPTADQTERPTENQIPEQPAGQNGRPEGEGGEGRIVFQKVKGAGPGEGVRGPEEGTAFEDQVHLTPRIVTDPNRFPVGMPMGNGYKWSQFPGGY